MRNYYDRVAEVYNLTHYSVCVGWYVIIGKAVLCSVVCLPLGNVGTIECSYSHVIFNVHSYYAMF